VKIWVLYKWKNETNIAFYRSAVNVYVLNVNSIQSLSFSANDVKSLVFFRFQPLPFSTSL
jgi:hypothetical protein